MNQAANPRSDGVETGPNALVDEKPVVSRRGFVRAVGAAIGSLLVSTGLTRRARASHDTGDPGHVGDPVFDEALLAEYKPKLITGDLEVEPTSIHGFAVRSTRDSIDTTALTYWVEYPVQLDASGFASHIGDHEPVYVFVRNEGTTDEYIDKIVYSGYHWLAAESRSPRTDDGTDAGRPVLYVHPQYHHYSVARARNDPRSGREYALKDLTSSLPRWLDDPDFHDALSEDYQGRGSPAYNPWIMLDKASWWRESGLSNYEQAIRFAWLWFGIRGAEGSDLK